MKNSHKLRLAARVKSSFANTLKRYLVPLGGVTLLGLVVFGVVGVTNDDAPANDNRTGAVELPNVANWCSERAAYTTSSATGDGLTSSAWETKMSYNVWFKFQATSKNIQIEMKTGEMEGSLRNGYVTLWDYEIREIASASHIEPTSDIKISHNNLKKGEWYYVSVDNHDGSYGRYRGSFSLCMSAQPDNDWKDGAIELTDLNQWSSEPEAYSTLWATPDESAGSCGEKGPSNNRWFKFQAKSTDIKIELKTGEEEGSLKHGYISLWDSDNNELTCGKHVQPTSDIPISHNGLTVGDWYYISVDNHWGAEGTYRGTFTLAIDTQLDNDWRSAAIELTDMNNWTSEEAAYSTLWATGDGPSGSCWETGRNYNRWFKFKAISKDIMLAMKTGGSEGSLLNGYIALWDEEGNEIACGKSASASADADITLDHNNLTAGNWYYISVDNKKSSSNAYRGTFTLHLHAGLDNDWKEAAIELTNLNNWTSENGEYSTLWATADEEKGSTWKTGPNFNRWYKFRATSKNITVEMKTGSREGTLRKGYLALWDESNTEIASAQHTSSTSDIKVSHNGLTVGQWYYISVDNHNGESGRYQGTFTLAVNAGLDNNWKEAATELTDIGEWCSPEQAFTTLWATPDEGPTQCQEKGPHYNSWFKFRATSPHINIEMKTGGTAGSLRQGFVTLWDGTNGIACSKFTNPTDHVVVNQSNLSPGKWYYISVDNGSGAGGRYRGTFTLCVNSNQIHTPPSAP